MIPEDIQRKLDRILPTVQKPGRYTGGEYNQVVKDWSKTPTRVALAFPDIYDIGMSNLGLAILYDIINQQTDVLAERVFAPWLDMEDALRRESVPLHSLETKHPLRDFDILGFSLPYEVLYTNVLTMLDLAGIPFLTSDRNEKDPLLIAGGHATYNPEPMAEIFDAFVIGEGEEVILEIIQCLETWKRCGGGRKDLYKSLAGIWGVYVPSLYQTSYQDDGRLSHIERLADDAQIPVIKRIVPKLPPPPRSLIVPFVDITHNRFPIEIMRGCTRGCRFCQAGMITRPVRERTIEEIIEAITEGVANTGFEEVGLLSLSSSDFSSILDLVREVSERFKDHHLNISLPSLRIESLSIDLMDLLREKSQRRGFTLAPEAATERMRELINKPVSTEQLLNTAHEIYTRGWHTIKLYFMIGHPTETLDDVQAIADLCKAVLAKGRSIIGKRARVHVSIGTFVPKPHTPFQWTACDRVEHIEEKQRLLKRQLRAPGLKLNWNDPKETMLEAWLSRGDRRLGHVILEAWKRGAKFDAWQEHFNYQVWMDAFDYVGLDPHFYTHRERSIEETLPWDHIDAAVKKQFLVEDYIWSTEGRTRRDCRDHCYACGILPGFSDLRRLYPGKTWECPEPQSPDRKKAETIPQVQV
ncbi:MAG: TIGR03960 family B12-binding radical SAM protein [Anaerolineaceae bacterium]|nr:MAG: TIGR03960 family B12-binding radical SAM protein [Anaerolineaceae bacterium]